LPTIATTKVNTLAVFVHAGLFQDKKFSISFAEIDFGGSRRAFGTKMTLLVLGAKKTSEGRQIYLTAFASVFKWGFYIFILS
jgi:hypothetical protein